MSNTRDAIIVAGLGRCGTTMLYGALAPHAPNCRFLKNLSKAHLKSGWRYKTHDHAPDRLKGAGRVVFLFGDPRDIAVSSHLPGRALPQHYAHLHADVSRAGRWAEEDTLRLGENFSSWYREHAFPVMTLRYETMWDHVDALRDFLGVPVKIPARRERATRWHEHTMAESVAAAYAEIWQTISDADDIRIW